MPHKYQVYERVQIKTTDGNHLGAPPDAVKGDFGIIVELCVAGVPRPGAPANKSGAPLMYLVEIVGGEIELTGEDWIAFSDVPDGTNHQPTNQIDPWNQETEEFSWGFGLNDRDSA